MTTASINIRGQLGSITPPWIAPVAGVDKGFKILYAGAYVDDIIVEAALQGMYARLPGTGTGTALPMIGRDRGIARGIAESDAAYASRLPRAFIDWKHAGSARGLIAQLWGYFSPFRPAIFTVADNGARTVWHGIAPNVDSPDGAAIVKAIIVPSDWDWDGQDATLWARFWVVLFPALSSPAGPWTDEGTWGDGALWGDASATWGLSATPDDIGGMRALIAQWQGAHNRIDWIIVALDLTHFNPGLANPAGEYANWSRNVAGTQTPARYATARYISAR